MRPEVRKRTVRAGVMACSLLSAMAVSCGHSDTAVSGTSGIALPGRVIWATTLHPEGCDATACQATYRVRIANTTHADLFVQSCEVLHPPTHALSTLPIAGLAGLSLHARATRRWTASFQLDATPEKIHDLAGATLRCSGEHQPDDIPAAARTEP